MIELTNPFVGPKEGNTFKPVMNSRHALRAALSSPSLASQDFQQRLSKSTIFKTRDEETEASRDKTDPGSIDWLDNATNRLFDSKITDVAKDLPSDSDKTPEKETKLNIRRRISCKLFDNGKGTCVYGSSCHYSHDIKSSETEPDRGIKKIQSSAGLEGSLTRRSSSVNKIPCTFYNNGKGRCEYGLQCRFSHAPEKGSNSNLKGHRRSQSEHLRKHSYTHARKISASKPNALYAISRDELNISTDILKSPGSKSNMYSILSETEAEIPAHNAKKTGHSRSTSFNTASHPTLTRTDSTVNNARKPCKNFNFGNGLCPFGIHCHFLHVNEDGTPVEDDYDPLQNIQVDDNVAMMFKNPYGQGDICASAVIPYFKLNGRVWAMILVEDKYDRSSGEWKPALSMFGGKVSHRDRNWLATAGRKFASLVGYKYGSVNESFFTRNYSYQDLAAEQSSAAAGNDQLDNIPSEIAGFGDNNEYVRKNAKYYTSYLNQSKLQVLYFPLSPEKVSNMFDTQSLENVDYLHLFDCKEKPKIDEDKDYYIHKIYVVSLIKDNNESEGGYKINPSCFDTDELPKFCDGVFESALKLANFVDFK